MERTLDLRFAEATEADAAEIAALRSAVAEQLTQHYGRGHWSSGVTAQAVRRGMRGARVLVARDGDRIVATLALTTKRPWAIDPACFTAARMPLYLTDMAVEPGMQRRGIGRQLLGAAVATVCAIPGDAIRLDAYDAKAGAGPFYLKCGFRERGRLIYRNTPLVYFELVL